MSHKMIAIVAVALACGLGGCKTFEGKPTPPPALPQAAADPTLQANTLLASLTINSPVKDPSKRWRVALAQTDDLLDPRVARVQAALEPRLRKEPQLLYLGPVVDGQPRDYQLRLRIDHGPVSGALLVGELLTPDGRKAVWAFSQNL